MKKLFCILLVLLALISAAHAAPASDFVHLEFEDGFSLSIPSDWVSFPITPDLAEDGYIYCLGSADVSRLMYIQRWPTDCATLSDLRTVLSERSEIILRPSPDSFIMYQYAEGDCTGCMTLFSGDILNLLFLPQSDPQTMLLASAILQSAESAVPTADR